MPRAILAQLIVGLLVPVLAGPELTAVDSDGNPTTRRVAEVMPGTVPDLFETQRSWVDPVNNLVAADNAGNIGFMVRGELPIRASKAARRLPREARGPGAGSNPTGHHTPAGGGPRCPVRRTRGS